VPAGSSASAPRARSPLAVAGPRLDRARAQASPSRPFRTDIEGLRAVAVVLVVAFHARLAAIAGGYIGVDVFYVISGFLITGLLVDELERTGSIRFLAFYARRARRLLPMAMLVLVAVAVGMEFFTPPLFRPEIRLDAISAALYYSNWRFAVNSVDYGGLAAAQNPVLHYWSLSVEEQFYLVWPLLLVAALWLRRRGASSGARFRLGAVIGIAGVCSLAYSLVATPAHPTIAFFATTTRVWEFAVGAGVALLAPSLRRVPRIAAILLGVAGLAAVVASAVMYTATTEFPGTAAIAPVVGTAAIIAAGLVAPLSGVGALLSLPPLRYVGRISYAWYLWHWPCLVFAHSARWSGPDGKIGWIAMAVAVAVSFALAASTHVLVEAPLRRAAWLATSGRRVVLFAGAATAVAILAVGIAGGPVSTALANVGLGGEASATGRVAMTVHDARESTAYAALHGCHVDFGTTAPAIGCVFGNAGARHTVVLLGDSHAAQWFPALEKLAADEGFQLVSWTKSGCPFTLDTHIFLPAYGREYHECRAWQANVLRKLPKLPRPAMVIVGGFGNYMPQVLTSKGDRPAPAQASKIWGAGMASTVTVLRRFTDRVVVLRDDPKAPFDVPACVSWDPSASSKCDFPRAHSDAAQYAAELKAGVPDEAYVDAIPVVCPDPVCRAVVDGKITYRDDSHLTAAYVATRWRQFAAALREHVKPARQTTSETPPRLRGRQRTRSTL
jgi:peptidoglycan/LPS O-acetylase OafA/YrhL